MSDNGSVPDAFIHCQFPAHSGELWEDVIEEDRSYVAWLVSAEGPQIDSALCNYLIELLEETGDE